MGYDQFDMYKEVKAALFGEFGSKLPIACENIPFKPPSDGGMYLDFKYADGESLAVGLSGSCSSLTALVQVEVVFSPGTGTDKARELAKEIAQFFYSDRMLGQSFVFTRAETRPIQHTNSGCALPVRFTVRYDS